MCAGLREARRIGRPRGRIVVQTFEHRQDVATRTAALSHPELTKSAPVRPDALDRQVLRQVTEFGRTLALLTDLSDVVEHLATGIRELTDADEARVSVRMGGDRTLVSSAARGGEVVTVSGQGGDAPDASSSAQAGQTRDGQRVVIPLGEGSEESGALVLSGAATERTSWLLDLLADHAAVAVHHALRADAERRAFRSQLDGLLNEPEHQQAAMSALAHDLRSPLLAIGLGCDMLDESVGASSDELRDVIAEMRIARQRLQLLAENLVEMGRLSAGALTVRRKHVELRKAVDAAVALVAPKAEAKGVAVEVNCDEGSVVWGDINRLRQIVANLLHNAIQASPPHGRISVDCARGDGVEGRIVLHVRDTGAGIAPKDADRIFLPYRRCASGVSGGAGIGLSISRELARRMGGDITVASVPGDGSTFTLTLAAAS